MGCVQFFSWQFHGIEFGFSEKLLSSSKIIGFSFSCSEYC